MNLPPSIHFHRRGAAHVFLSAAALAMGLAGCGDPNSPAAMQVHPVRGKVVLPDGHPLTSGRVVFVSSEKALAFSGPISPDGTFALKSSIGEGAPEGGYKVRIEVDPTKSVPKKGGASRLARLPFPFRYADETTSNLTVMVKAEENEVPPFNLTK